MSAPLDRYAGHFERLCALPAAERAAALAALPLTAQERAMLRELLDADADADDPLTQVLADSADGLMAERVQRLGPYRLLREIGVGGMGTVFLAERVDGGFAQRVAIKLLRGFPTREGLRRLRQERQILAGLDHPNIARLLDGGETADGQPWLALEHIDGLPLLAWAAQHAPRLAQRLALFDAVLDAVAHAHQRLVIHRDIKPANVLVNAAGEVKLLDFGIARLLDLDTGQASRDTSTRVFTLGYASPEQREGRAVTTISDIYSLGRLLAELVGATAAPAGVALPALPLDTELAGIIAKASDPDPAHRYASAGELRDDLDRYRDGRPVRAARVTRWYRLRKFVRRHRLAVALTSLASAALLASWGYALYQAGEARSQARRAARHAGDVRELANRFISGIFAQIVDVPGTQAAQLTLLDTGIEYLNRLQSEAGDDTDLLLDLADGYNTLSRIQRRLYTDPSRRVGTAQQALQLVEQVEARLPPTARTYTLRLSALTELACAEAAAGEFAAARTHFDAALGLARAPRSQPDDFALARQRAEAEFQFADEAGIELAPLQRVALYAQAAAGYTTARALAGTDTARDDVDDSIAATRMKSARLLLGERADPQHLAKAMAHAEEALRLQQALYQRHPRSLRHLANLVLAAGGVAKVAGRLGDYGRAREAYAITRDYDARLQRLDPDLPVAAVNRIALGFEQVDMERRAGGEPTALLGQLAAIEGQIAQVPAELADQRVLHAMRAWLHTLRAELNLRRSEDPALAASERRALKQEALHDYERGAAQIALAPELVGAEEQATLELLRSGPARVRASLAAMQRGPTPARGAARHVGASARSTR